MGTKGLMKSIGVPSIVIDGKELPKTKIFGGKRYKLAKLDYDLKRLLQDAKQARAQGHLARVIRVIYPAKIEGSRTSYAQFALYIKKKR